MRTVHALLITSLIFVGLTACGTDSPADSTNGQPNAGTNNPGTNPDGSAGNQNNNAGENALSFTCSTRGVVVEGKNSGWNVGGEDREFIVKLPNVDASTPVSVVFAWHGVGDTMNNFSSALPLNPNGDSEFPFIAVYPQGLQLLPVSMSPGAKKGMEWDIFEGAAGTDNIEAMLFEEILGCLKDQYTIDGSRIYVMGFSGGAILTNMLHSRYPQHIGAIYAMSGAWFNDQDEVNDVNTGMFSVNFDWEALNASDTGAVIVSHGGDNDWYGDPQYANFIPPDGVIIDFEVSAQYALDFLKNNNRTVIDCPHQNGHQPHPQVYLNTILDFFKVHQAGKTSPYVTEGLDSGFPAACTLY